MNQRSKEPKQVAGRPEPAHHSDNARSRMPERDDRGRKQSPADKPGRQSGGGEPSVG